MTRPPIRLDAPKRSKYRVRNGKDDQEGKDRRTLHGILFASEREMKRYWELTLLPTVMGLHRQKMYKLEVNGVLIGSYRADFVYLERQVNGEWKEVVEDSKGVRTDEYVMKNRLMKAIFGIEIRES